MEYPASPAVSKSRGLVVRRVALNAIQADPANARLHGERNVASIRASLARFGQAEPLIVQAGTMRLIAGHGRLLGMQGLGWQECDIVELDLPAIESTALAIALNRTAELAEWDNQTLASLLKELQAEDAMEGIGFEEADLDGVLRELEKDLLASELADPGALEPATNSITRTGDLWVLGGHRLLCGDSTEASDLARLMGGQQAALLCTDPPYLVDYDGANHPQSYASPSVTSEQSWDTFKDPQTGLAFFKSWLTTCLPHCRADVPVYQWHAHRRQALVEQAWVECGLLVHQQIIWVKARGVLTRSHLMWQHEPCFYG